MKIWGAALTLLLAKHHTRSLSLRRSEYLSFNSQEAATRIHSVSPLHVTSTPSPAQSEPANHSQQILLQKQQQPSPQFVGPWAERAAQLQEYADRHGHCIVPKRYKENPSLGNWYVYEKFSMTQYLLHTLVYLYSHSDEHFVFIFEWGICAREVQGQQTTTRVSQICDWSIALLAHTRTH